MNLYLITVALGVFFARANSTSVSQQLLTGPLPEEALPGIGFDLSTEYGTATIKYSNGTVIDLGKITGDSDYYILMSSLSERGRAFQPPFESRLDDLKWRYQRALRRFRRMRGLPATEDIGTLAVMIRNLKVLSEAKLGQHIQEAAITIPSLPKLVRDDLFYAAQYAGIYQLVPLPHTSQELDETLAARAGMGYGMCEHWEDFVECYYEELEFPPKRVLSISFTNDSLTVSNIMIYPPQSMLDAWAKDYLLGYAFRYETQNLWGRVGELVRTVAMQVEGGKIEELIIMGECAEEKKFLNAIWQALGDLEKKGFVEGRFMDVYAKLQVPGFSALYVGSRGAAEIARRTRIQLDRLGREDL